MSPTTTALQESIVGAWSLGSYVTTDTAGGDRRYPLGQQAQGLIVYTADGFMSVQISSAGRAEYADGALHGGTGAERAAAAAGYLAYTGTYDIQGDIVTHRPQVSLFPNWEGTRVPRRARIRGQTLTLDLVTPIREGGSERTGTLTWHRAPTPSPTP